MKIKILILYFLSLCSASFAQIQLIEKVCTEGTAPYCITISRDGKFLYTGGFNTIQTYSRNTDTGSLDLETVLEDVNGQLGNYIYASAESPDSGFIYFCMGRYLLVMQRDKNTGSLTEVQVITRSSGPLHLPSGPAAIVISDDNRHLYTSHRDQINHYSRDTLSGELTLVDSIIQVNYYYNYAFDISIELSRDNRLLFATGLYSISVFKRDSTDGTLSLHQRINSYDSNQNQGLGDCEESKPGKDGRYLYTISMNNGTTVSSIDPTDDTLSVLWTVPYLGFPRPGYLSISPNGKGLCVSSKEGMELYKIDSTLEYPLLIKQYPKLSYYDLSFGGRKVFDNSGNFLYTVPIFTDTIYLYRVTKSEFEYPNDSLPLVSAIAEAESPDAKIYPNPTTGAIHIVLPDNSKGSCLIRNSLGQIIQTKNINSTRTIDTRIYGPPGIYFIEVRMDSGRIFYKIMKK